MNWSTRVVLAASACLIDGGHRRPHDAGGEADVSALASDGRLHRRKRRGIEWAESAAVHGGIPELRLSASCSPAVRGLQLERDAFDRDGRDVQRRRRRADFLQAGEQTGARRIVQRDPGRALQEGDRAGLDDREHRRAARSRFEHGA